MSLFARNLRFLRKQRGLNQDDISLLFNKRANTVGNWENSKSEPSIGELVKLADYFNIGLQDLLHADLQKKSLQALDAEPGVQPNDSFIYSYPVNESGSSLAQDGTSDSFWLILRELRALNEKMDLLKIFFESGARISGADKSNH